MKVRLHLFTALILVGFLFWGCKDNPANSGDKVAPSQKQFVWEAMNYWYYWQEQVPKLADNKDFFRGEQDYQDYLLDFSSAEAIFEDLLFNDNNFEDAVLAEYGEDDFSFFIDNYEDFQARQQGESFDFGFEYSLIRFEGETNLFGYVQYVVTDSPAETAGIERGDLFTHINGNRLNTNNYTGLLSSDSYQLGLANYNQGDVTPTGETKTVNAGDISEDPIFISKLIDTGTSKVGYMLYNSFQTNSHLDLNNVFGEFASDGIDELVLDLRYNGGGAVITSRLLTSMISGLGSSSEFGRYSFNSKRNPSYGSIVNFLSVGPIYDSEGNRTNETFEINKLSLDRLYVLTSFKTASASESVINSLRAYIDVIVIGDQTVGKDDISVTLYDSGQSTEFLDPQNANPSHLIALQPIIGKLVNRNGESEGEGYLPDYEVLEYRYLGDLPPLGDENEPLLAAALTDIEGGSIAKIALTDMNANTIEFTPKNRKTDSGMYIYPSDIPISNN